MVSWAILWFHRRFINVLFGALLGQTLAGIANHGFAFLYTLREWTKTIEDYEGDLSECKTIAISLGKKNIFSDRYPLSFTCSMYFCFLFIWYVQ